MCNKPSKFTDGSQAGLMSITHQPRTSLYTFMDLFTLYNMTNEMNPFDDFKESLNVFFKLDLNTQNDAIKLFNDRGPHLNIYEFVKVVGIKANEAENVLETLAILIYHKDKYPKNFTAMLNKSKMPKNIKSNINNFTTKLNKVGKNGFEIRYFINASTINESTLEFMRHDVFLKAVEDYNRKTVCHTPVIRLEFSFDGNEKKISEHVNMSIEQLQIMINDLTDIYENSAKTIETYNAKQHPDFLIVGNK